MVAARRGRPHRAADNPARQRRAPALPPRRDRDQCHARRRWKRAGAGAAACRGRGSGAPGVPRQRRSRGRLRGSHVPRAAEPPSVARAAAHVPRGADADDSCGRAGALRRGDQPRPAAGRGARVLGRFVRSARGLRPRARATCPLRRAPHGRARLGVGLPRRRTRAPRPARLRQRRLSRPRSRTGRPRRAGARRYRARTVRPPRRARAARGWTLADADRPREPALQHRAASASCARSRT